MASQGESTVEYPVSSGASTTSELVPTQLYYQSSDPLDDEFSSVTVQIAQQLSDENKANICHLYRYELGPERRNMIGIDLLEKLQDAGVFHARNITRFVNLLSDCSRHDLINKYLEPYRKKHAGELVQEDPRDVSNYETTEIPRKKTRLGDDMEEFDVSEVDRECQNASVHGVIVDVSSVHSSKQYPARKYFNADVTDGRETLKFVCYNPAMHPAIERTKQRKRPCTIKNCTIKQSTYPPTAGDFELHYIAKKTKVVANPGKKFEISDEQIYTSSRILEQLSDLDNIIKGQSVTVRGQILKLANPTDVNRISLGSKLRMQECRLADRDMSIPLKIWQEDIGKILEGKWYQFIKVKMRQYQGERFLTTTEDSSFKEISDMGKVTMEITLPNTYREIRGKVAAVTKVSEYKACPACNAKVDTELAECSKCSSLVDISMCTDQVLAKITVQDESKVSHNVTAFTEVISQIIGSDRTLSGSSNSSQIKRWLRSSDPALFRVNENDVIIAVKR